MTGEQLKTIIDGCDVSQAEIGRRLNKTSSLVSSYFRTKKVSTECLENLCKALEVDISYFYVGTPYAVPAEKTPSLFDSECDFIKELNLQHERQLAKKDEQIAQLHAIIKNLSDKVIPQ